MVFSFFKKPPEKMVARPAAVPRSTGAREDASSSGDDKSDSSGAAGESASAQSLEAAKSDSSSPDFSDFVFSEGSPDLQIETNIDPVDAEAEEAAILFANGQDEAVRSALESAVRIHNAGPGERLWLMLFDLYQLTGKKAAFEALGIDYARSFEKSPPGWRDKSREATKAKAATAAGSVLFRGNLTGDNDAAFDAIRQSFEKNPKLRLDLSKVIRFDAQGCGRLLSHLQQARKARRELELLGREALGARLEERVESGRAEDKECWLLLLELYQLQGQHEAFEEVAINYAVTFEVSPPSWEANRVATPEPAPQVTMDEVSGEAAVGAYVMRGDIKAFRFGDMPVHAEAHDPVIIDCVALTRIDFISAGALLNVLTTIRRTGKQIVFRHPNHLVAELFGIVGLKAVATIVLAKR